MPLQIQPRLLDGAVLCLINNDRLYGYTLSKQVQSYFDVSDSAIYPVLHRLKKKKFVITYDKPFEGRNRRYYQITDLGTNELQTITNEWSIFSDKVDQLMGEQK